MAASAGTCRFDDLIAAVRGIVVARVDALADSVGLGGGSESLFSGKMLRTRLAARIAEALGLADIDPLADLCAATELLHLASLCHDDVIDNALLRRHQDALWVTTGASAAVLLGDLLLCDAMELARQARGGAHVAAFLAKARQVVQAETRQELIHRGQCLDAEACLQLARDKTGPLFAFPASLCGGDTPALTEALDEAGCRVGTAYQLADDLLDVLGDERAAGKTLGTDEARGKFTLPAQGPEGQRIARGRIDALCVSSLELLAPWPHARAGLRAYLIQDLQPVLAGLLDAGKLPVHSS